MRRRSSSTTPASTSRPGPRGRQVRQGARLRRRAAHAPRRRLIGALPSPTSSRATGSAGRPRCSRTSRSPCGPSSSCAPTSRSCSACAACSRPRPSRSPPTTSRAARCCATPPPSSSTARSPSTSSSSPHRPHRRGVRNRRDRRARGAAALRARIRRRADRDGDGRHRRALPPRQRRALQAAGAHRGASCSSVTLAKTIHPEEWSARKRLFERMLTGEIRTHQTQGRVVTGAGRGALDARQRHRADRRRRLADRVLRPVPGHHRAGARPAAARRAPRRHARARAGHDASSRPRRCCSRRSAPTSAGRSARCGWPTRSRGELAAIASWRHRAYDGDAARAVGELTLEDLPVRVTHSGQPVWTEALMAGAASPRASAIAAAGLSGAVCLPIVAGRRLPRRDGVLLPRARGARRAAARAARHHRHADRPLHPAPPARRRRAGRRPRRGARGDADEVAVPGHHEPRDPHADERRDRDGRAAARHRA